MAHLKPSERWIMVYPYGDGSGEYGIDHDTASMQRAESIRKAVEIWHDQEDDPLDGEDNITWRRRVWAKLYRKGYRIVKFKLVPMEQSAVTARLYGYETADLWR